MAKTVSLKDIHNEIRELRLLYKDLLDRLLPVEKPTREESRAIEEPDEVVEERELLKTLGVRG